MASRTSSKEHGSRSPSRSNNRTPVHNGDTQSQEPDEEPDKKPSKIKQLWAKTGLDVGTLLMMGKGALPPTIAVSIYQADAVAKHFSTLGYLVAITSILGFAIMPRAKFIQTMFYNIIATCIGTSVALFAIWTSVKAREHTTPRVMAGTGTGTPTPGATTAGYNSSQSAVCAIWLFFQVYVINTLRAKFPQFNFPVIIYSIFVNVAMTYGPQFPTMSAGISFATRLIEAFLTGFAIATGVSLFILPMTSRTVVFKEMAGYIGALRGTIKAQTAYMRSLEDVDIFRFGYASVEEDAAKKKRKRGKKEETPKNTPEAAALKAAVQALTELHGKLHGDIGFAKREMAYGKLNADDLSEMCKLLRGIMLPVIGLSSIIDLFERLGEKLSFNEKEENTSEDPPAIAKVRSLDDWHAIMRTLHQPFAEISGVIDDGLEHVLLTLSFKKRPKGMNNVSQAGGDTTARDVEAAGDNSRPGEKGFAQYMDRKTNDFYAGKEVTLRSWCEQRGINLPPDYFQHPEPLPYKPLTGETDEERERNRKQLYLVLYMEYLLWAVSQAVLTFVRFADGKVEDGTTKKKRLILPSLKRVRKWIASTFKVEDSSGGDDHGMDDTDSSSYSVQLGQAFGARKDPEHLPPRNGWERLGNGVRAIPKFLRSKESAFGFRVACATMSIAIIAYLRNTQRFFVRQRLVWAMIMVAISMMRTAGLSTFNFILRVLGTVIAMVASFIVWYIVDGRTIGVIVFLWLWMACGFYIVIKKPAFVVAGILSVVTAALIIGYELQSRKIGIRASESSGQPFYPTYLLAPYRLACVAGGLAVAFFWTIFPYPISEHSELRIEIGRTLYLLANFYSVVHETVGARIRGDEGHPDDKHSPGRRLEKLRHEVFSKLVLMLTTLRTTSSFTKWQYNVGGAFPKEQYDSIINHIAGILNHISLIGYASSTFVNEDDQTATAWLIDFRELMKSAGSRSHEITSMLCLLSSSISNGQPLPPYLKAPQPYGLSKRMESLDRDILSIRHIAEPGYAAFAVMQVSSRCIIDDLEKLIKDVKTLVGELDFSFHVISTSSSSNLSDETLLPNEGDKGKTE